MIRMERREKGVGLSGREIHFVKTLPAFFQAGKDGRKNFEVRKKDRDYRVGDILWQMEFVPPATLTGRESAKRIQYLLDDSDYCKEGYVILGLEEL